LRALFLLFFFTFELFATYKITNEQQLTQIYKSQITPFFDKRALRFFTTQDGLKIAYKIFTHPHAKANIVISSGRTESMVKYKELIYDLYQNGYSVFILDHRGQGYSSRLLKNSMIGHVDNFIDYVDDLRYFVANFVPKGPKRVLLAHSMGGAIATLYVERYRDDFQALILSSAMHEPLIISEGITKRVCNRIQKRSKNLKEFVFGTKESDILKIPFERNDLTHSKVRYGLMQEAYKREPNIRIGGMSKQWLREACLWSKRSRQYSKRINIPVLLFEAGEDTAVTQRGHRLFCQQVQKCTKVYLPEAYHELFIEKDSIRAKVIKMILEFCASI
jgi:lysophospholipase